MQIKKFYFRVGSYNEFTHILEWNKGRFHYMTRPDGILEGVNNVLDPPRVFKRYK